MVKNKHKAGITRRDVLQSMALAFTAPTMIVSQADAEPSTSAKIVESGTSTSQPATASSAAQSIQNSYPPAKTGLRGTHAGAFETAHNLRDGQQPYTIEDTGQYYDLVIVGAGISGLSAAWMYRQQRPHARILLLDNHDDFGGHAKRNEFTLNGQLHLMNGGTLSIQSPRPYSKVAESMLLSVGINSHDLVKRIQNRQFYEKHGLSEGIFFDAETYGRNAVIRKTAANSWLQALSNAPLSPQARKDIARIEEAHTDYLPKLTGTQKKEYLSSLSYRDYLQNIVQADPDAVKFYQQRTHGEYCIGIEAVSALDCWGLGLPGFQGLKLPAGSIPRMGPTSGGFADTNGSVDVHLPDGGATIARALVRGLIPAAIPGHNVYDLITAKVDYSLLDQSDNPVQIRLNAVVVRAQNNVNVDKKDAVLIEYISQEKGYAVHATQCIMACWNMVIPYLCPELPDAQKTALKSLVKAPLVYASVAIKNWSAFEKLGVNHIYSPAAYFSDIWLNEWVAIGSYHTPQSSGQPIVVHMVHTPCEPGQNGTDQLRIGRAKILATSLETFEQQIRGQLDGMLSCAGFDSSTDILNITVNRWPHGYAYEYDPMLGAPEAKGKEPYVIGRQRFGAIAIANSDSGGLAYMDSAIDQAHRAVNELLHG